MSGLYANILVPVDGSDTAARGLREAIRIARRERSRLTLLHVVVDYATDDLFGTSPYSPGIYAMLREQGERILRRAAAGAKRSGVAAKTVLLERPGYGAADVIVAQAKKSRANLIVIGTHGRRGIRRLALGSDAEQVVRSTPVPVLLVRARKKPARKRRKE